MIFRKPKGSSGAALLTLSMITGLSMIALLIGVMQTTKGIQSRAKTANSRSDWNSLLDLIRLTYSSEAQCKKMFENLTYTGTSLTIQILGIKNPTGIPAYAVKYLDTTQTLNGYCATAMSLKPMPGTSAVILSSTHKKRYSAYLSLQAKLMTGLKSSGPEAAPLACSTSLTSDLFSSTPDDANKVNLIPMVIYTKPDSDEIESCFAVTDLDTGMCDSIDGSSIYMNGKCTINSLNINPSNTLTDTVLNFGKDFSAVATNTFNISSNGRALLSLTVENREGNLPVASSSFYGPVEIIDTGSLGMASLTVGGKELVQMACETVGGIYSAGIPPTCSPRPDIMIVKEGPFPSEGFDPTPGNIYTNQTGVTQVLEVQLQASGGAGSVGGGDCKGGDPGAAAGSGGYFHGLITLNNGETAKLSLGSPGSGPEGCGKRGGDAHLSISGLGIGGSRFIRVSGGSGFNANAPAANILNGVTLFSSKAASTTPNGYGADGVPPPGPFTQHGGGGISGCWNWSRAPGTGGPGLAVIRVLGEAL